MLAAMPHLFAAAITFAVSVLQVETNSVNSIDELPVYQFKSEDRVKQDWLVHSPNRQAKVWTSDSKDKIILENGLIRRVWKLQPNLVCIAFDDLMQNRSMLRSVRPEGRVKINGTDWPVGGLDGQTNHAFLTDEALPGLKVDPKALKFVNFEVGEIKKRFEWNLRRHSAANCQWPPKGISLRFDFEMPVDARKENEPSFFRVSVNYEMYDGVPLLSKSITIQNRTLNQIQLDEIAVETLALVEETNWVEYREGVDLPRPSYLHVETDFAFGGFNSENANRHVVHWRTDPLYKTQVNWARQSPCLLEVRPTYGPAQTIAAGSTFRSFRTFELVQGYSDRERKGLALRRMYRTIAPWVTENPITHHLLSHDPEEVRRAIDQAAEVGFEAIILSFGSGFNMENGDPTFIEQWKGVADYAESKGIELGSYSLFSSRDVGAEHMIVSPAGQKPTHGKCPAVTSAWGQKWLKTIRQFYAETGFDQFENDGPYPGDVDTTERLPLQKGEADSRWIQWKHTAKLYSDLRGQGIYINAPDYYYLNGSNKCGMGYRETNWSLPRAAQPIHTRQNIFDGTWTKTPSMGWMFVPLSQYHGGGKAATIEPLDEHIEHYRQMLDSNLALGVQAHYRGPRLYDTERVRDMVRDRIGWFKKYRSILESDVIHGRRADGRRLDWMLHVNPKLENKGMLCIFNPTDQELTETLNIDLYYTGMESSAMLSHQDTSWNQIDLARDHSIELEVAVPARGMSWYLFRNTSD